MRKKLSTCLIALAAMLTFSPQAWGDAPTKADIDKYKEMPLTFEMPVDEITASFNAERVGYSGNNEFKIEYRLSMNDGDWGEWKTWIDNTKTSISNPSASDLGGGYPGPYKKWKVQLRGTNTNGLNHSSTKYIRIYFTSGSSTRTINVYGNIMSLIVGYDTSDETQAKKTLADANEIPCDYCFFGLFSGSSTNSTKTSVSLYCEHLIFPATKLKNYCYANLFKDNVNGTYGLKSGPIFLANGFVDKEGAAVQHSFENLCSGATGLTQIAVNFSDCPGEGNNNLTNWMGTLQKTLYAPEAFRNCSNNQLYGSWTKSEFQYASVKYHIIFKDEHGTTQFEKDYDEGAMPSYGGTTNLEKSGYALVWSPAIAAATTNQTYTATYVPLRTLTVNTAGRGTATLSATDYADCINTGTYKQGTFVQITITPNAGSSFTQWSDNKSTSLTREVTLTNDDVELTAEFDLESEDKSINVYQVATADTTKILYALTPVTKGSITYTPIDLGYGVAWCNKNLNASEPTDKGKYYQWGSTSYKDSYHKDSYYDGSISIAMNFAVGTNIPLDHDAANYILGAGWHIPSADEWQNFISNCTKNGNIYTGKNGVQITLPATGYIAPSSTSSTTSTITSETSQRYWSSTKTYRSTGTSDNNHAITFVDGALSNDLSSTNPDGRFSNAYPIRPIYQPTFTIYTLTVNVGTQKYVYKCQSGQTITVTAVPNTADGATFKSWSGASTSTDATVEILVDGDKTLTAEFNDVVKHTVTIKKNVDSYGTISATSIPNVVDGTAISVNESKQLIIGETTITATPITSDAQYTYAFSGWDIPNSATTVTDDITITANFTCTTNQYTLMMDACENGKYSIKIGDAQASTPTDKESAESINYNTSVTLQAYPDEGYKFVEWAIQIDEDFEPEAPRRAPMEEPEPISDVESSSSEDNPFTFPMTEDVEYKAIFAINTHTLTWAGIDGATLSGDYTAAGQVAYGTTLVAPTVEKTGFNFMGWDPTFVESTTMPDNDVTYTAQWEEASTFTLEDQHNEGETYYATLADFVGGDAKDVTYARTFQGGTAETPYWNVFSLPFDYMLAGSSHPFAGKVLDLSSASYDAVNDEVTLNFLYETYQIEANKPYALINKGGDIVNPEFENVTFVALSENTYSVPCTTGGSVTFVNTTYRQQMQANNRNILFIGNNQLLYPGANAYLRAFRGYFSLKNVLPQNGAPKRVRLMIEGESVTTGLSTEFAPEVQSAKRIEDGVLIIERNGNRYDAQGKEMK